MLAEHPARPEALDKFHINPADVGFRNRCDLQFGQIVEMAARHGKCVRIGAIVNGPGESKHADIGVSLPGARETPAAPVFIDGAKALVLRGPTIAADFKALAADDIEKQFAGEKAFP